MDINIFSIHSLIQRHIDDALRYQRDLIARSRGVFLFALVNIGRLYGSYVTMVYTTCKTLHLLNVITQFYFLNKFFIAQILFLQNYFRRFLDTADYPLFGGHVLYDLFRVGIWFRDIGKGNMIKRYFNF